MVKYLAMLALLTGVAHASDITVTSPHGNTVAAPVWIRAHTTGCNGKKPVSFGYSVDSSSVLVPGVTEYDIDTKVTLAPGPHVVHFKVWTGSGAPICPVVDAKVTVETPDPYVIPASAIGVDLTSSDNWKCQSDAGTEGSATGSTAYPITIPATTEPSRLFSIEFTSPKGGGYRCANTFAKDTTSTHFAYNTYVYLTNPAAVENLELDNNQVLANGDTVIYATQCSANSGMWDYTIASHWVASSIPCNPRTLAANTWHHIQIVAHRDAVGNVTYDWVRVDGVATPFMGATGNSAEALGWTVGDVLPNFQVDSSSAGNAVIYASQLTIYRW